MRAIRSTGVALALLTLLAFTRAGAEPVGCEVVVTGYPGTPGYCGYAATGPGTYEVQAVSGFIISVSSDGGKTYRTEVAKVGRHEDPLSTMAVQSGELKTVAGDIVIAAIGIQKVTTANGPLYYQDGRIKAGDKG